MTPADLARAEAFGRLAARSGLGITACPYEADGNADQRVLAGRFVRAYVGAGGTVAVDLEGESPANEGRTAKATGHTAHGPVDVTIRRRDGRQ